MKRSRIVRWSAIVSVLALVLAQCVALGAAAAPPVGDANLRVTVVEHPVPTAQSEPGGIVRGPDGAMWFVETNANRIGRMSPAGVIAEYPVPTATAIDESQGFIRVGPDGALWFNEDLANQVGRLTTTGQFTEYPLPADMGAIRDFAAGPDGNLWMTALGAGQIVKMTTQGTILARYQLGPNSAPVGIVAGPDGALWFADRGTNAVGRITTDGGVTEYPLPPTNGAGGPPVLRLAVGPDRAIWFTMFALSKIGRIDMAGKITTYDASGMGPVGITSGPGQRICFAGYRSNEIGCLSMSGRLTRLAVPTPDSAPYGVAADIFGRLWFTEMDGNNVGEVRHGG